MMKNYIYTVVSTTYNDESRIKEFIASINDQTILPQRIIVADGGSTDRTVEILEKEIESEVEILVIPSDRHLTYAQGFNRAIEACDTEMIGIMQTGVRYTNDFFEVLIREIGDYDAAYSRKILNMEHATRFQKLYASAFWEDEIPNYASNSGYLFRKHMFDSVGGFNTDLINNGEDVEFSWLAQAMGFIFRKVDAEIKFWDAPETLKEYQSYLKRYLIGSIQLFGYGNMEIGIHENIRLRHLIDSFLHKKVFWLHWFTALYKYRLFKQMPMYADIKYDVRRSNVENIKRCVEAYGYQTAMIWGAGDYGKIAKGWCDYMNLRILGFIDSVKKGEYLGIPIFSYNKCNFMNVDLVIIAVENESSRNKLKEMMETKGYIINKTLFLMEHRPKTLV